MKQNAYTTGTVNFIHETKYLYYLRCQTYKFNKTASNNKLLKMEKDYTAATTVELILHSIWTISCWKTLDE